MYTVKEWMSFLTGKKEHYKYTDEFVIQYRQKQGGYIAFAKKVGHSTEQFNGEPNQKWHFFESLMVRSLYDGSYKMEDNAETVYYRLKCPELLLWICEASGVDVRMAKKEMEQFLTNGNDRVNRKNAYMKIREVIPWKILEKNMEKNEDLRRK